MAKIKGKSEGKAAKFGTVIKACTCHHTEQDALHGRGQRAMNLCQKGEGARCTVCSKVTPA